ncbi:RNA polymerase-associated protein rtf1 [Saitoella coloradoensis]
MADDLDNELLELAGHADGSSPAPQRSEPSKKRRRANSDDFDASSDEGESEEEERQGGESEDEESDEEAALPYPLEGKYKDEADRAYVLGLTEVERESLLYDREMEHEKIMEAFEVAQRARQQRASQTSKSRQSKVSDTTRRSARDKKVKTDTKSKLSELVKRREDKSKGVKSRRDDSESPDDLDRKDLGWGDSDDSDADEVHRPQPRRREAEEETGTITLEGINAIRISRKFLGKFLYYPAFENAIRDAFVRINIGQDRGENVYRVAQIKGVVEKGKTYNVEGTPTNLRLECQHGKAVKDFEMSFVSSSPITEKEYARWVKTCEDEKIKPPGQRTVERKIEELKEFTAYTLTPEDITAMLEKKQALRKQPGNHIIEQNHLKQRLAIALSKGNTEEASQIQSRLEDLEQIAAQYTKEHESRLSKLARLNERNRRANVEEVRKAELRNIQEAKKAAAVGKAADPFARLKTVPKRYYNSQPTSDASQTATPQPDAAPEVVPETTTVKKPVGGVDDVIASIDIDIDL